jgi:hypothetical protein
VRWRVKGGGELDRRGEEERGKRGAGLVGRLGGNGPNCQLASEEKNN